MYGITKSCATCLRGRSIPTTDDVICRIGGVVNKSHCCSSYRCNYIASLKVTAEKCSTCIYFDLKEQKGDRLIGRCKIHNARTFDSTRRPACSKWQVNPFVTKPASRVMA